MYKMHLKVVHESMFGLSYTMEVASFEGDAVDKVIALVGHMFLAKDLLPVLLLNTMPDFVKFQEISAVLFSAGEEEG